ncbi:Arginase [hydrothermal vent metagenome]|uniref:Arginase n=1 Tax=hydrothermal vent metagenome TaxID=652676 RepID=A0A3B0YB63_9ZZZZ
MRKIKNIEIPVLGVATSLGGPSKSCAQGAQVLKQSGYVSLLINQEPSIELQWEPVLEISDKHKNSLNTFHKQSCVISQFTQQQVEDKKPFLVLGGDHSIAAGTWAGVLNQLPADSKFALIWIDAHLDSHTLESSPSGNIHGMPVSLLLGEAEHKLQKCFASDISLNGQDLYMFGIRSFEAEELVLLSKKKVNIFDTERIEREGGTEKVLTQLIEAISQYYDYYAISLDLDAIDPKDAPGVETRAKAGLSAESLLAGLDGVKGEGFLGLEIAEFDPGRDKKGKTQALVYRIISRVFG